MDQYGLADTPSFEVDSFLGDGITPTTPVGATCTVWNVKTDVQVSGNVSVTTSTNRVVVIIPNSMVSAGVFRAELVIQLDANTFRTFFYDYVVASHAETS